MCYECMLSNIDASIVWIYCKDCRAVRRVKEDTTK